MSIAAELRKYLGLEPEFEDVGRGRLEVLVNGKKVWEKKGQDGWKPFDVVKLLRKLYK